MKTHVAIWMIFYLLNEKKCSCSNSSYSTKSYEDFCGCVIAVFISSWYRLIHRNINGWIHYYFAVNWTQILLQRIWGLGVLRLVCYRLLHTSLKSAHFNVKVWRWGILLLLLFYDCMYIETLATRSKRLQNIKTGILENVHTYGTR